MSSNRFKVALVAAVAVVLGTLAVLATLRAEVLVSEVVRAVGGSLAGVEFRDAGRKQLKGIPSRQRVFEVVW